MYKNQPLCDLRSINSAETAQKIKKIKNVVTLILPDRGSPDLLDALAEIPKENVVSTIFADPDLPVSLYNGSYIMEKSDLLKEQIICVNGQCIVPDMLENTKPLLCINGSLIKRPGTQLHILSLNGKQHSIDFEHFIEINKDWTFSLNVLELCEYKTLFYCTENVTFSDDISTSMLLEKLPYFIIDGDVSYSKDISAYLDLHSKIDGELTNCNDGE